VDLEPVLGERLGHLDADVPTADDADGTATRFEELAGWPAVGLLEVALAACPRDVLAEFLPVGHRPERVDALAVETVDGWCDRFRAGRHEQVVVGLDDLARVAPCRHGPAVGVDVDDPVARAEVDIPLLPELLGGDRDEVLQGLYLALDVVRQATGTVGHPFAPFEDDDIEGGVLALCLASG